MSPMLFNAVIDMVVSDIHKHKHKKKPIRQLCESSVSDALQ